ncbi:MAG: protein jag [Peptococcaceae bacterium]|nr:protein jag [Peptococcaceae bacterium]
MKSVEKTAKSVRDGIESGLAELGLSLEQVEVIVLEEPTKGLFGLWGAKPARVRVTKKSTVLEMAVVFLTTLLRHMGADDAVCEVTREGADEVEIAINATNSGLLIGRRGQTLDAIQQLTAVIYTRSGGEKRLQIDVGQYRERRKQSLIELAKSLAERVRRTGRKAVLEPMSASERRIVHVALQDEVGVLTYSEGDEPYRKIIIAVR